MMKTVEINAATDANVTQMRDGAAFGNGNEQLLDGNMIPRLCSFAGENACKDGCQLKILNQEASGKECAENNILETLASLNVSSENFELISATKDRVGFADSQEELDPSTRSDGYTMVPKCNAFFFRPDGDKTPSGEPITHAAMRMADCGDVIYDFKDSNGEPVTGIAHFSRTNMRGPSAYMHELDGKKVSWGEYVLGNAIKHYGTDPASVKIKLVAAVNRDDFVHNFTNAEKMESKFPGWSELGFMHPQGEQDFDCLIDYREMIEWQLGASVQNPNYRLGASQIDTTEVINTGDLSLGYASHHAAQRDKIARGRDLYLVGLNTL